MKLSFDREKFTLFTLGEIAFPPDERKTAAMKINTNGKWKTFVSQQIFHPVLLSSRCSHRHR